MIVVTTDAIPGKRVVEVLGVVHQDEFNTDAKRTTSGMAKNAERMGANAIVGAGYSVGGDVVWRIIAYGTAVVVEDAD